MLLLKAILRLNFCTAILLAITLSVSAQQSQNRILDWFKGKPTPETKVLEIVDITVEGQPIVMGQPFAAGKDWFKTLVFRVRNISAKPVKAVVISFNIPELDKAGRKVVWNIPYSIRKVGVSSSGTDVWDYVNPGDEVRLTFTDILLESSLHKSVDGIEGGVNQVNILPETILTFKDGSSKRGGILIR
jgi:hypothetical protein